MRKLLLGLVLVAAGCAGAAADTKGTDSTPAMNGSAAASGATTAPVAMAATPATAPAAETPVAPATPVAAMPMAATTEAALAVGKILPYEVDANKVVRTFDGEPAMEIDPSKTYTAEIVTSRGKIDLDLFAADAPRTVNNFVFLARHRFYDGLTFHRVEANFMIQGGDPNGDGTGGPGYEFADEFTEHWHRLGIGALAMANSGPDTNGSQFFITHVKTDWLNGKHVCFGQVTSGQDVVNATQKGDVIQSITIREK